MLLALLAGTAHAESKADKLFAKGKKLLAQKKYDEACKAFEQSDEAETGIGTKLNVARCYEEWGKIATALRWYQDAEQMAKDHKDPRAEKIKGLEDAIDADVPRLTIKAGDGVDTAGLTLDGAATRVNEALAVDPGAHELVWTTPDGNKKTKTVPLERGGSSEVKVDLPIKKKGHGKPDGGEGSGEGDRPIVAGAGDGSTQRLVGLGVGGAGIVAVGVASVLTLKARSKYNDALSAHCVNDRTMCDDIGLAETADARHRANVSTVIAVVGAAAVATGVVLYLISPHGSPAKSEHAYYLVPEVDADGAAVLVGGRF